MASNSLELSLSLKPADVPKTILKLPIDLSKIHSVPDKLSALNDSLLQYQEELSKIEALKRQLPQCMLLLMEAIDKIKENIMSVGKWKEPESGKLIEFLPMKRKHYQGEQEIASDDAPARQEKTLIIDMNTPADDPYHLWNPIIPHKKQKTILHPTEAPSLPPFHPCKKRNIELPLTGAGPSGTSSSFFLEPGAEKQRGKEPAANIPGPGAIGVGGLNLRTEPATLRYHPEPLTENTWKNKRRSWSPQLHAKFVEALNILGGVEIATPKQIRDVMRVDGLTTDQVKSHLQKYRLHARIFPGVQLNPAYYGQGNIDDPGLTINFDAWRFPILSCLYRVTPDDNLP